jgi:hypothetical protein
MKITKAHVDKIHTLLDAGLVIGVGNPKPGEACVEAVICMALGLPHGDDPKCVLPCLRTLKINLNDRNWSSNKARAEGLRRLAIAQLGSDTLDAKDFVTRLARMTIQTVVPAALRSAAKMLRGEHPTKLLVLATKCEKEPTEVNARKAQKAAYAAAAAANAADAAHAAYAAANAAANAAAAAYAAANAADAAAAADAYDEVLATFAENVVQILIEMKAPGCQWLEAV